MKIIKKYINPKNKKGSVTVLPDSEEDIWYLYNLIMPGDMLRVTSFRKVKKQEGNFGVKKVDRKQIVLTVGVLSVDFESDERGTSLNLKTKNLKENEWVMLGQVQTIEVKLFSKLQIMKDAWDKKSLELLDEASDDLHGVDSLILLFDDGYASFFYIKRNFTKQSSKIVKTVPKKKSNMMDIYNKRIEEFDQKVWRHIFDTYDLAKIKVVVIAGPGNPKTRFFERLRTYDEIDPDSKYRELAKNFAHKFVSVNTSSTFKSAVNEVMKDPKGRALLEDTKAVKEMEKLEFFFSTLQKNPNCAVYGEREIGIANEQKAIKLLLITDGLLRAKNFSKRKKFIRLVNNIEANGAEIYVFNENHVSGQKLKEITGIAAVLKFPVDLEFDNGEDIVEEDEQLNEELFQTEGDLDRSFIYEDADVFLND